MNPEHEAQRLAYAMAVITMGNRQGLETDNLARIIRRRVWPFLEECRQEARAAVPEIPRGHLVTRFTSAKPLGTWEDAQRAEHAEMYPWAERRCQTCGFKGGNGYIEVGANHQDVDCPECTELTPAPFTGTPYDAGSEED